MQQVWGSWHGSTQTRLASSPSVVANLTLLSIGLRFPSSLSLFLSSSSFISFFLPLACNTFISFIVITLQLRGHALLLFLFFFFFCCLFCLSFCLLFINRKLHFGSALLLLGWRSLCLRSLLNYMLLLYSNVATKLELFKKKRMNWLKKYVSLMINYY